MTIAIVDADSIVYKAGFGSEERSIVVTHTPSGKQKKFKNKTEFWGHHRNKDGGWLGDLNHERVVEGKPPFNHEEFEIEEIRSLRGGVPAALHNTKSVIHTSLRGLGVEDYMCYIGSTEKVFRWHLCQLQEYKGNRKTLEKPILFDEIRDYILKHHSGHIARGDLEADDEVVIQSLKLKSEGHHPVVVSIDKDVWGQPVLSYNPDKPDRGVVDGDCFGGLWLNDKNGVEGIGRVFKYFQVIHGDATDNYKANIFSNTPWAEKSAYESLKDVSNDKDAWKVMWDVFNMLYPEPQEIVNWRGEKITVDALFVFQEMFTCAHMKRHMDDSVNVESVLKNMGIV